MHTFTVVEETGTERVWECVCGCVTVETVPEPAHHTPVEQRKADHVRDMAAIEDGSVWREVPAGVSYRLDLRRRFRTGERNHIVIRAVWRGGSRDVLVFPWTVTGAIQAQEWCDQNFTTHDSTGAQVQPGQLTAA